MADAETMKQVITQAVVDAMKTAGVAVCEEMQRQAIGAGYWNTTEIVRPQARETSLIQTIFI